MKSDYMTNLSVKFSDLFTIIGGGTPKTSVPDYWGGEIPWLSVKDFCGDRKFVYSAEKSITQLGLENSSTKLLQEGDIIVSARGTVGELAMLAAPMAFNQSCFGLRAKAGIDSHYLYYLTQTKINELKKFSHGCVFDTITRETFDKVTCKIPPLPIQRKIASILSALDDKIETNNAICRNLEEQAMALYKSWFVDFEPFQKCVFEESEIGMIPRGWRVSKMSDFFPVITGKKNANVAGEKGQYPFFSCSQEILWTDDYSFEGKAILVAGNGDFNVKRYNGKFEAYQRTYVLIPDNSELAGILYYAISKGLSDITMGARGSVINFITKGNIADYKIAIPNNLIDLPIITTINSLNETIDNLKAENQNLSQLRNSLLPKLMSGEIDLSTNI